MLTTTRHILSHKISVATMIEIALWLSIPHAIIGIGWAVTHPDYQSERAKQLSDWLPAGVDGKLVTFGETIVWWPVLALLPPDLCAESNGSATSSERPNAATLPPGLHAGRAAQFSTPGAATLPARAIGGTTMTISTGGPPLGRVATTSLNTGITVNAFGQPA